MVAMLLSWGRTRCIVADVRLPSPVGLIGDLSSSVARTAHDVTLGTIDVVLASRFASEIVDHVVASPLVDRTAQRLLTGPEVERLLDMALRSERVEQLLGEALESRLVDETITRLIEETIARLMASDGLWLLVDEVAASPAITEAITQHGVGFADQVADEVRERSRHADAWMETIARRLLRRRAVRMATPEAP
jgi:uncharacterized membrane-anchored protein YjiN (DUF445 family)